MEERTHIDNNFYNEYGERWYSAYDDPVALLRAENEAKIPWIINAIRNFGTIGHSMLDVGCGGGFLTNDFSKRGFQVTGVDLSPESIKIAQAHDVTHSVNYLVADAYHLPFPDQCFDIVTSMDFLEHVEIPANIIKECARVLRPNGLFFFHTFNRNPISKFTVITLVEKFIKNTPKNMHVGELFIKPEELEEFCMLAGIEVLQMTGLRPVLSSISLKTIMDGIVSKRMRFKTTNSKIISYMGVGKKLVSI